MEVIVDGENAGKTSGTGRLISHGVQVAVPHTLELQRGGYEPESLMVSIPVSFQGKKFKYDKVALGRKAAERPPRSEWSERPRRDQIRQPARTERRKQRESTPSQTFPTGGMDADEMGL